MMEEENDHQFKTCSCKSVIVTHQMAPLFSKADLNKLWYDVQNEKTLICAKFGKDLFNILQTVKSITVFLTHSVYTTLSPKMTQL